MYQFKAMNGLTRTAIGSLWVYMIVNAVVEVGTFYRDAVLGAPRAPDAVDPTDLLAVVGLLALLITGTLVLRWMYRASANAHAMADGLAISPGWAMGWYFIPIANLWKPFDSMKETWLVSHYGRDWASGHAPYLLNLWWGLWIVASILGNLSWRLQDRTPQLAAELGLADAIVTVPLSLILIRIMRQVSTAQDVSRHAEVFA